MILEIIGITLAYIEIRYKPLADKIEEKILKEETRIKETAHKLLQNKLFSALITVFITVVFFIEIPYLAGFFDRVVPKEWSNIKDGVVWATFPILILFSLGFGFLLFSEFVSWLNRFSHGHAIGALGVVVTALGLLGESYQVITIWLHW
jgi:hypothetical protein